MEIAAFATATAGAIEMPARILPAVAHYKKAFRGKEVRATDGFSAIASIEFDERRTNGDSTGQRNIPDKSRLPIIIIRFIAMHLRIRFKLRMQTSEFTEDERKANRA